MPNTNQTKRAALVAWTQYLSQCTVLMALNGKDDHPFGVKALDMHSAFTSGMSAADFVKTLPNSVVGPRR